MIAARLGDAVCEFLQVHPGARRFSESLADALEIVHGKRVRQRFVDQFGQRLAGVGESGHEILHERLLMEFGRGKRQPDRNLLARTRLGRVAAGHRELAVSRQQDRRHLADVRVCRDTFECFRRGVGGLRENGPELASARQQLRILFDRPQCLVFAQTDAQATGLARVGIDDDGQEFRAVLLYRFCIVEERLRHRDRQGAEFADDALHTRVDGFLAILVERHLVFQPGVGVVEHGTESRRHLFRFLVRGDNPRCEFRCDGPHRVRARQPDAGVDERRR